MAVVQVRAVAERQPVAIKAQVHVLVHSTKVGFEGGQMPLQRRVPKVGFKNPNRVEYVGVNLDVLQKLTEEHTVSAIDFAYFERTWFGFTQRPG